MDPHAFIPSPGSTRCAVPGCGSPRLAMIHAVPEPDEPVPPFPAEPAFGSPEAVKQAAARLLRHEADMQDALHSMAEIPSDLRARLEESQDDVQRLISERDGLVTQLEGAGRALEGVKAEVEHLRAENERAEMALAVEKGVLRRGGSVWICKKCGHEKDAGTHSGACEVAELLADPDGQRATEQSREDAEELRLLREVEAAELEYAGPRHEKAWAAIHDFRARQKAAKLGGGGLRP